MVYLSNSFNVSRLLLTYPEQDWKLVKATYIVDIYYISIYVYDIPCILGLLFFT